MKNKECTDPYGNKFPSITQMLKHHNIPKTCYHRLLKKMSSDDIIKNYSRKPTIVKDHLGNEFKTQTEMLEYYNVSWNVFNENIKKGIPLKQILTKQRQACTDHLGNHFKTHRDMCKHHNISINSVKRRLRAGWTLEKALTTPQTRLSKLPEIVNKSEVKAKITIIRYINKGYFLCICNNQEIVLHRNTIIDIATRITKIR